MCVLVLILAGGAALVITGIAEASPVTAIIGVVLLAVLGWSLVTDRSGGDDDDVGEA